jgi:hypothetical protein
VRSTARRCETVYASLDEVMTDLQRETTRATRCLPRKISTSIFRTLKMIPLGAGHLEVVAESFNLLNHSNITLLNTSFGSGYNQLQPSLIPSARRLPAAFSSLDYEF